MVVIRHPLALLRPVLRRLAAAAWPRADAPAARPSQGHRLPQSQAWLWAQWGTTRALRQVREIPAPTDGRRRQTGQLAVEFWSADWSPWRALAALRHAWPALRFTLRPDYADPGDG
jgi:hypothetical protein